MFLATTVLRGALRFALPACLLLAPVLAPAAGEPASASAAPAGLAASATPPSHAATPDQARLLQALRRGGVVVLIRHSRTDPGVGDPPGFRLEDCSTQRNLSEEGRQQARRLGQWFEANRIVPNSVRASPWCRAEETARLAFGRSQPWVALSNLLVDRRNQEEHRRAVLAAIAAVGTGNVDVFVAHGVTINAFVDVYLQQGEMAVVRPSGADGKQAVEVVGRFLVP